MHIPVDDVEDENLIDWFPRSNAFIKQGLNYHPKSSAIDIADPSQGSAPSVLEDGSGVLIHW